MNQNAHNSNVRSSIFFTCFFVELFLCCMYIQYVLLRTYLPCISE
jgi:hypothetical protein